VYFKKLVFLNINTHMHKKSIIMMIAFIILKKQKRKQKRFTLQRKFSLLWLNNTLSNYHLCLQFIRISPSTFNALSNMFSSQPRCHVSKSETIMIGLHFLGQNPTIREQCALFGLSNGIIVS
jgi:hypothetical protein